jgi:hypothetical protein
MNFRTSSRSFLATLRAIRGAAATIPRWGLPFFWFATACLLLFSLPIFLVAAFCTGMRPLYERRG